MKATVTVKNDGSKSDRKLIDEYFASIALELASLNVTGITPITKSQSTAPLFNYDLTPLDRNGEPATWTGDIKDIAAPKSTTSSYTVDLRVCGTPKAGAVKDAFDQLKANVNNTVVVNSVEYPRNHIEEDVYHNGQLNI